VLHKQWKNELFLHILQRKFFFQQHLLIKIDLQGVGSRGLDWIHLVYDGGRWRALVNMIVNLRVPWSSGNMLT